MTLDREERERWLEAMALRHVTEYPGYFHMGRSWSNLEYFYALWRLWRQGRIRVDWWLRLWPGEQEGEG